MDSGDPRRRKPNIQQCDGGELWRAGAALLQKHVLKAHIYPGKLWFKRVCHASVASVVCDLSGSS